MRLFANSITRDLNMPRGGGGEGLAIAVEVGSFVGTGKYVLGYYFYTTSTILLVTTGPYALWSTCTRFGLLLPQGRTQRIRL
jgi:hypothetical protein